MLNSTSRFRSAVIWVSLIVIVVVPLIIAASSPLLAWRDPIYIVAGFAGVLALSLLLFQPLLSVGILPGLTVARSRRMHRRLGAFLVLLVVVHVIGLWATSPPDVIDALLLVSPTPFSIWGVMAMWSVLITACLAFNRRRLSARMWRYSHKILAVVTVAGTTVHAMKVEGTMGYLSKLVLCVLIVFAVGLALLFRYKKHFKRTSKTPG